MSALMVKSFNTKIYSVLYSLLLVNCFSIHRTLYSLLFEYGFYRVPDISLGGGDWVCLVASRGSFEW